MKNHIIKIMSVFLSIELLAFILPIESFALTKDTPTKPIVVVSLGDSYSSGDGNEPFYNQNLPIESKLEDLDWLAHRSEKSWPGKLNVGGFDGYTLNDYHVYEYDDSKPCNWFFAASSGAEIRHMSEKRQRKTYFKRNYDLNPLGDKIYNSDKKPIYFDSYRDLPYQLDVFKNNDLKGKVDYVTMTLGGNDARFEDIIEKAFVGNGKIASLDYDDEKDAIKTLDELLSEIRTDWEDKIKICLENVYETVYEEAGKQAYIIVAGYPKLFSEEKGIFFSFEEVTKINENVAYFNDEICELVKSCDQKLCGGSGHIVFVDVETEFDKDGQGNHGAYADDEWIRRLIILPNEEDLFDKVDFEYQPSSAYSLHPNEKGIEAYARCVQEKIDEIESKKIKAQKVLMGTTISTLLDTKGDLYIWGSGKNSRNEQLNYGYYPVKIMSDVKDVYKSRCASFACITNNGNLYTWGTNEDGQLGTGDTITRDIPTKIMSDVKEICISTYNIACITKNGDLYTWGHNCNGNLGTGDKTDRLRPTKIMSDVKSVSLSENDFSGACIKNNGDLYTWGYNGWEALGIGIHENENYFPNPTKIMSKAKKVVMGADEGACITTNGDLYTWGNNIYGQVGTGNKEKVYIPTKIMSNVKKVTIAEQTCHQMGCITESGDLYMWGNGRDYENGNGTEDNLDHPVKIMTSVKDFCMPGFRTACITESGDLYMWGENYKKNIYPSSRTYYERPKRIMQDVRFVSCSSDSTACIKNKGEVCVWGANSNGQLGIGYKIGNGIYDVGVPPKFLRTKPTFTATVATHSANAAADSTAEPTTTCLIPESIYNYYALKNVDDGLTPENLMYITQVKTNDVGMAIFDYGLKEDTPVEWLAVPMESSYETATEINVQPAFGVGEDEVFTDIKMTVEGEEFTADNDGVIAITGFANGTYEAIVSKPNYAPRKVTITVGGENADVKICKYGDDNGDGVVNLSDLGLLQQKLCDWDVSFVYDETADTNGDGKINLSDLGLLQQYVCDWDIKLGKAS